MQGVDIFAMASKKRHKVFISYHHGRDESYKSYFCKKVGSDFVDKSVEEGDIDKNLNIETIRRKIRDEFIADASVTVVLIGKCTWQRKHVDWEIGSSLRCTKKNSRCGLLGILLPTHYDYGKKHIRHRLIPPRLADNCDGDDLFGKIYFWPDPWSATKVRNWIHHAFMRRKKINPDNTRKQFRQNRSGSCFSGWSN